MANQNLELQRAEVDLPSSAAELQAVFAAMSDFVFVFDAQGRHLKTIPTNPILLETHSDPSDQRDLLFLPPTQTQPFLGYIQQAIDTQKTVNVEYGLLSPDAVRTYFEASVSPMSGNSVVWVARDVTERKHVEHSLKQNEQLFRSYFDTPLVGIAITSPDKGWIAVNDTACEMLGYPREELVQLTWSELTHPDDLVLDVELFDRVLAGDIDHYSMDKRYLCKSGEMIDASLGVGCVRKAGGGLDYVIAVMQNITERKRAEEALRQSESQSKAQAQQLEQMLRSLKQTQTQLIQSEKMSSLGQLVAGIAHEVNNPINFIHGNISHVTTYVQALLKLIQLYQAQYPNPTPVIQAEIESADLEFILQDLPKVLSSMAMGSERIRQLVLSMRNFSRLDEAEMKLVDIHEGIDSTLLILQSRLKPTAERPGIQIIKDYGSFSPVECYVGQINQVFMNILANAIDALEDNRGRSLQVPQKNPDQIKIHTSQSKSGWLTIQISDNGPGISEKVKQQMFDPFFTTKAIGKGTGLGLAISYQIVVEKHRGQLECHSAPGEGTEFVISIPTQQQPLCCLLPDS